MDVYTAHCVTRAAQAAWTQHTTLETAESLLSRLPRPPELFKPTDHPCDDQPGPMGSQPPYSYTAASLTQELSNQVKMQQAHAAETAFVTLKTLDDQSKTRPPEDEATEIQDHSDHLTIKEKCDETVSEETEVVVATSDKQRYWAKSMVGELLSQQAYTHACAAETKYTEVKVHSTTHRDDQPLPSPPESELAVTTLNDVVIRNISIIEMVSTGTATDPPPYVTMGTNTESRPLVAMGTNTEPHPVQDVGCNTLVNCLDVLRRAKEVDELNMLKAERLIIVKQVNEEKSQRMVADHLVKIVQSDLSALRQRNMNEVSTRMRLENELSDAKLELTHATRQLADKAERIKELEESLTGTSLLVRKLEEQNSISLMNRGGIDYMVQAKLAEGRAREAEQKLDVLSVELLQAQTEVGVLLQRAGQAARDKTESVSSKVHTQLLQLADEKAAAAEQRTLNLERELRVLKDQLSRGEGATTTVGMPSSLSYGLSYGTTYSSLMTTPSYLSSTGLSSTLYPSTSVGASSSNSMLGYLSYDQPSTLPPTSLYPLKTSSDTLTGTQYLSSTTSLYGTEPKVSPPVPLKPADPPVSKVSPPVPQKPADPPVPKEVELPLISDTIPPVSHVTQKEDSGSSDWSSSDDDEGDDPLLPSAHTSLISQWEWRSRNKTTPTATLSTLDSPPSKKRPPPIAPKPKHLEPFRQEVSFEAPSSFNEPVRGSSLLTSKRVKGPRGRRLPVRFRTPPTPIT